MVRNSRRRDGRYVRAEVVGPSSLRGGRRRGGRVFFFSSRRRHTRYWPDWSSDVCSSDLFYFGDPRVTTHGPETMVGATWMTREDREREIQDHVHYLDTLFALVRKRRGRARARVTVLGRLAGGRVGEEGRSWWLPFYLQKK